jgi:hypothetical protein
MGDLKFRKEMTQQETRIAQNSHEYSKKFWE